MLIIMAMMLWSMAMAQDGVVWIEKVPTASWYTLAPVPVRGERVLVGIEGESLVTRFLGNGSLVWAQPLNISYEGQPVDSLLLRLQGVGNSLALVYVHAELGIPGGQLLVWNYWQTFSLPDGALANECDFPQAWGGPVLEPVAGGVITNSWKAGQMRVSIASGTGEAGCKTLASSSFPSSTGGAFSTGSSPVMVTSGAGGGSSIVTLTTQFSNDTFPLTTMVFRLDPTSLAPLWAFSPPPTCAVAAASPTSPNILMGDDFPQNADGESFYAGDSCADDQTISVMYSADAASGALRATATFSSPVASFGGAYLAPVALVKQDHGKPPAPCFRFSTDFACFSPGGMLPLYPPVLATDANFLSTSGGYLWQRSGNLAVGYNIAGFFAAPKSATYSTPESTALPPIRALYSIPHAAGLSQPTALLYTNEGIALVQLTKVQN